MEDIKMNQLPEKEAKAIDALIAGALLPEVKTQALTDGELDALLADQYQLLPEDRAALDAKGNPFQEQAKPERTNNPIQFGLLAIAMNRKNGEDQLSDQTRLELEKKARELLG
jgi:hypothetical protein